MTSLRRSSAISILKKRRRALTSTRNRYPQGVFFKGLYSEGQEGWQGFGGVGLSVCLSGVWDWYTIDRRGDQSDLAFGIHNNKRLIHIIISFKVSSTDAHREISVCQAD
jgi:hypothetical protein